MGCSAINASKRIQAQSRLCVCVHARACMCAVEEEYNDFSLGCFGFEVLLRHAGENVLLRIRVGLMQKILNDNGCTEEG